MSVETIDPATRTNRLHFSRLGKKEKSDTVKVFELEKENETSKYQ